jgi:hypothetical protein
MSAIILPFTRGPFNVRIEPERGGKGWMVITPGRTHGWLHGDRNAALADAHSVAGGFGVSVGSSAWRIG